jgi:hypothetical protein
MLERSILVFKHLVEFWRKLDTCWWSSDRCHHWSWLVNFASPVLSVGKVSPPFLIVLVWLELRAGLADPDVASRTLDAVDQPDDPFPTSVQVAVMTFPVCGFRLVLILVIGFECCEFVFHLFDFCSTGR